MGWDDEATGELGLLALLVVAFYLIRRGAAAERAASPPQPAAG